MTRLARMLASRRQRRLLAEAETRILAAVRAAARENPPGAALAAAATAARAAGVQPLRIVRAAQTATSLLGEDRHAAALAIAEQAVYTRRTHPQPHRRTP